MFIPVLTLTGELAGTLPRPPVAAAPGGRWLTATYEEGEFAVWSPTGQLERLIGPGRNAGGPGEFGGVTDLIVDSFAGSVYVFSNSTRIEVYSLGGDYLEGIRLPSPALMGARLGDGTIITSTTIPMAGPKILLVTGDSVVARGPARRMPMPAQVRAGDQGVWTGESAWYQFDHHALPSGQVDFTIRREVSWFPELSDEEVLNTSGPLVMGFTVDPRRRMIFARVMQVKDPDAPSGSPPTGGSREAVRQNNALYFDGVVEAFSFEGDLVASTRFDSGRDMPWPIGGGSPGNLWYRLTDEGLQSIVILRPELIENTHPR